MRVQIGSKPQTIVNFADRLIELGKDGDISKLHERLGGKPNGIELFIVELQVFNRIPLFLIVIAALVTVVNDRCVIPECAIIAHGVEVFFKG